jgi:hypothetical protein
MLAQGVAVIAYAVTTARSHDLPAPLPQIIGTLGRWVGIDAASDGANVTMGAMRQAQPLGATWELLLGPATFCFIVGGAVFVALLAYANVSSGRRGRYWLTETGTLLMCVVAWLPIRVVLLMSLFMHRVMRTEYDAPMNVMNQFWSPWVQLLMLAGPALLAAKFVRAPVRVAEAEVEPAQPGLGVRFAGSLCALLAVALLTASVVFEPIGTPKGGRVLVDEFHSSWEPTDKPFDTEAYGSLAAYNYAVLYDYCSRFYEMGRISAAIDDTTLRDCDVLIAKIPTARYEPHEVAAIERFVRRGGSILLVGEHTDVWGSGTYLNDIAENFGFTFRMDCLFNLDSTFEEHYDPPVAPHPLLAQMGPLDFAVSASVAPGWSNGRAVIWNTGLRNAPADYHASNFYPQVQDFPESRYGSFVQLWATQHGRGRVVAFTDSTIWSNFCFFDPGKSELFLGMVEWLNRESSFDPSPWLAAGGVVAGIAMLLLWRRWDGGWLPILAAGALGWAIASTGAAAHARSMTPAPAKRPYTHVTIDRTTSDAILPKAGFIGGKEDGFGIFERWILRLGYFFHRREGPAVFDKSDLAVFFYPTKSVSEDFRRQMVAYVEGGGHVLVLDSPENTRSTTNALLEPLGVSVGGALANGGGDLTIGAGWPKISVIAAREVAGGTPLITLDGKTVAATVTRGKGSVVVIGFGSRFCDAHMGYTGDQPPDATMRAVYDLEFGLLRSMVEGRPLTAPPAHPPPSTAPVVPLPRQ